MVTFFFFSTVSSPTSYLYSGYSSDEMSEYKYADPFEGEGPYSETPPPDCNNASHEICIGVTRFAFLLPGGKGSLDRW